MAASESDSQFLVGFEGSKILRPSKAYSQACSSYPYRISELVFGSLLASYILGFVSIGASQLNPKTTGFLSICPDLIIYLSISCSFCFLTAAFYSVYHNSILTMPNVPISDLTTDFLIAISQAVFFGLSIIWPSQFMLCLGLLLLIIFWRQEVKFRALAKFFFTKLEVPIKTQKKFFFFKFHLAVKTQEAVENGARDKPKTKEEIIHHVFSQKLKQVIYLEGWGPVKFPSYVAAGVLLIIGVLILFQIPELILQPFSYSATLLCLHWFDAKWLRAIMYSIVALIIFFRTRKRIQEKAVAVDDYGRKRIDYMDSEAVKLAMSIRSSYKS